MIKLMLILLVVSLLFAANEKTKSIKTIKNDIGTIVVQSEGKNYCLFLIMEDKTKLEVSVNPDSSVILKKMSKLNQKMEDAFKKGIKTPTKFVEYMDAQHK